MSLSIVILAAGKGTRMKSNTAKVLHKLCGKAMLAHIIEESLKVSTDVHVILGHQADKVQSEIEKTFKNIHFHTQDLVNYPGTGGALKGVSFENEKVLILNGDMPLVEASDMKAFLHLDADIVMSTLVLDNPFGYGRVVVGMNGVERIVEHKDASEEELAINEVNAGVYLVKNSVLKEFIPQLDNANAQKEYYLTDIVAMAKAKGLNVQPLQVNETSFMGVNSKLHLAQAENFMLQKLRNKWMEEGVIMHLPESIYLEKEVTFLGECELEAGVVIKGKSIIENSLIKAHSVIEDAILRDSDAGPMARIRPNSELINTHIGNFVETKKASLKGVKAGHLSYIGDALIDEGTNIGAGVITCNYDGKNKHQTVIGKNVFVGSDCQLVAPVEIADDIMIGAGTTLSSGKYTESGELIITRSPMKRIKNYFYKFFKKEQ